MQLLCSLLINSDSIVRSCIAQGKAANPMEYRGFFKMKRVIPSSPAGDRVDGSLCRKGQRIEGFIKP